MSARIPAGFFETRLFFTCPGQDGDVITSFGWEGTPPTGEGAQALMAAALGEICGNLSSSITLTTIDFVIGQDGPDDITFTYPLATPGQGGANMLPVNNAFLVQKRTLTPGRRGRGRNFLPGVAETAAGNDGIVDSAIVTGINTNIGTMLSMMATEGAEPRLFHESAPFTPSEVTTMLAQPKIATQRGRLR